ncbi:MAG: HlyC/CorC family transporter [Natronospirillum sp.]|uniref:HlyC/CorC family transporter n=1 Tax=Natronospirillum sp. TaxID=2812955 RepID=UPI0025DFA00C|nr:HlyC/CorC family transporter [Natronospirillum sp.]MCH8552407.1 HlyC/CorC family transporter [Natronospirillum sp.]
MNEVPIGLLFAALAGLLVLSAFFSSSETGMMAINRYRLRHRADSGHRSAIRVRLLLEMPERLIGVILIGNNLVNIVASALTTVIAIRLYPENPNLAITFATGMLTLIILIFAEVTPKTLAQKHPEGIAYPASWILRPLLTLLYPAVVLVNSVSRILMWILNIRITPQNHEALDTDELRSMVSASGSSLAAKRQNMLLGILDLDNVTVEDIMIPRNELAGINLDDSVEDIRSQLNNTPYTRLPIYKGDLDRVIGFLHIRDAAEFLTSDRPTKVMLSRKASAPYFVPETTPLQTQLVNFQRKKLRLGLVVDEYGDVQGLVTLDDILEEIVGEFTTDVADNNKDIHPQSDGSYVIDGAANIRDINRILDWSLPVNGAKTLSGLVIEQLEDIPDANMSLRLDGYQVEILQVSNNTITACRLRKL